jgi:hypothetical protein
VAIVAFGLFCQNIFAEDIENDNTYFIETFVDPVDLKCITEYYAGWLSKFNDAKDAFKNENTNLLLKKCLEEGNLRQEDNKQAVVSNLKDNNQEPKKASTNSFKEFAETFQELKELRFNKDLLILDDFEIYLKQGGSAGESYYDSLRGNHCVRLHDFILQKANSLYNFWQQDPLNIKDVVFSYKVYITLKNITDILEDENKKAIKVTLQNQKQEYKDLQQKLDNIYKQVKEYEVSRLITAIKKKIKLKYPSIDRKCDLFSYAAIGVPFTKSCLYTLSGMQVKQVVNNGIILSPVYQPMSYGYQSVHKSVLLRTNNKQVVNDDYIHGYAICDKIITYTNIFFASNTIRSCLDVTKEVDKIIKNELNKYNNTLYFMNEDEIELV